jgi:hypothetical protein
MQPENNQHKTNAGPPKPSQAAAGHTQPNSDGGHGQTPNQTVAANTDTGVATPGAELSPRFYPTTLKHYSPIAPLYCLVLHALSLSEHYEDEDASELNDRRNKLEALLNEYAARCPSEPKLSEYSKTIRNIYSLIATALRLSPRVLRFCWWGSRRGSVTSVM